MSRLLLISLVAIATAAVAQPTRKPLKQAAEALSDAADRARRQGGSCQQTISANADQLANRVAQFGRSPSSRDLRRAMDEVATLASNGSWSRCNDAVMRSLHRATDALDDARRASWNTYGPAPADDDDDNTGWNLASMGALQVQLNANYDREPAVKVSVPELTLRRMRGQAFYLAARFRSYQGNWTEWVTTQQWNVPSDPFVWRNAFQHFFRYSTLAEEDFADGRFIAHVAIFDATGRELAFREVSFRVQLPTLPPAPPVMVMRDCGTGPDVGCTMIRDGRFPMDGPTFEGFMRAMQSTNSEMLRTQTAQSMFTNQSVTAVQFGLILDLFQSDMLRFQVAQYGAPRVVNPQHALGYSAKFRSDMFRASFSQMMAQQQSGIGAPGQPPPPPHHNPYRPPSGSRDCGTGPNDPGCMMSRDGRTAMDGVMYGGLLRALQTTGNELTRQDIVMNTVRNSGLTAMQLGQLMTSFNNEITLLEVCTELAPYVMNPQHALGFASQFDNSILAQQYVQVMSEQ